MSACVPARRRRAIELLTLVLTYILRLVLSSSTGNHNTMRITDNRMRNRVRPHAALPSSHILRRHQQIPVPRHDNANRVVSFRFEITSFLSGVFKVQTALSGLWPLRKSDISMRMLMAGVASTIRGSLPTFCIEDFIKR